MASFQKRLVTCLERGQMTIADLSWWFERPYSTVATWIKLDDRQPRGPSGLEAERRLQILERGIKTRNGFPVPNTLSNLDRPHHIEKLFNDNSATVSRKNSSRGRVQMRNGVQ